MVAVSLDTLQPLPQIDSEQLSDDCFTTYTQYNGDDNHTQYAAALFIHN